MHLASLATTDGESPAVRLFVERATAVEPRFAVDETNTSTIATVCERLDGMPLAIELAAARITVMTPAELLAGLDDRFQLLSGGRRRQRQRTLEATLDWSYNLLEPKHQDVFRALGVFVGGFDVDAVAVVTDIPRGAALDMIEALVAKSLVVRLDAPWPRLDSRCSKPSRPTPRIGSSKPTRPCGSAIVMPTTTTSSR